MGPEGRALRGRGRRRGRVLRARGDDITTARRADVDARLRAASWRTVYTDATANRRSSRGREAEAARATLLQPVENLLPQLPASFAHYCGVGEPKSLLKS